MCQNRSFAIKLLNLSIAALFQLFVAFTHERSERERAELERRILRLFESLSSTSYQIVQEARFETPR
jgi:hypothetical protein